MANLLTSLFRRSEISRLTLSDYVRQREATITNNPYAFTSYPQMTTYRGRPIERVEDSYSGLAGYAYRGDSVVAACMRVRRDLFRQAKFCWRELGDSGPGKIFRNDDLSLLESPWPNGTTGELLTRMITDVDLCGNSFILNEGDRLRWLRPDWVSIVLTGDPLKDDDVDVFGYVYTPGGIDRPGGDQAQGIPYQPDQICHWSPEQDPMAFYRGMSWVSKALEEIHGDRAATTHKLAFFRNGATLGPIVRVPKETTLTQFKEFVQAAEEAHAGAANAYRTMYVGGGAEITLAAADFRQLDLKSVQGGIETRIAAVAGVHPVLAGLSEGLAGSSLNSGNFAAARRATAEMTLFALWQDVCGALQAFFDIPDNAELWIREKEIPFLREERLDQAEITKTKILAIEAGMRAGFKPDPLVKAVDTDNLELLDGQHTGLFSVQMQPPGTDVTGDGPAQPGEPPAPVDFGALRADLDVDDEEIDRALDELFDFDFDEIERRYNPSQARIPKGFEGGGRFRSLTDRLVSLLSDWAKGEGPDDPLDDFDREQLRKTAKALADKARAAGDEERAARLMPRRGASSDEIKLALYKDVRGSVRAERDSREKPSAKFTLQHGSHAGKDVGVFKDTDGRPSLFEQNDAGKRGGLVEKFDSLAELQSWAKANGETRLAAWAGRERKKLPEGGALDLHTPAEVANLAKGLDMTVPASHEVVKAEGKRRIEAVLDDIDRMVADGGSNKALLVTLREHRDAGAPKAVVDELTQVVESGDKSRLRALSAGIRAQLDETPAPAKAARKVAKAVRPLDTMTEAEILDESAKIPGTPRTARQKAVRAEADAILANRVPPSQSEQAGKMRNPWNGPPSTDLMAQPDTPYHPLGVDPNYAPAPDSEVFDVPDSDVRKAVESAWFDLTGGKAGEWVNLADLRERIGPRYPFRQVNRVLRDISREPGGDVIGEINQKVITPRQQDARVNIGYQPAHLLAFDGEQAKRIREEHAGGVPGGGDLTGAEGLSSDPKIREVQVENRIRAAYKDLTQPGKLANLADIRDRLGVDIPRAEQDAALKRLIAQPGVIIIPESNQSALTPRDRAASARIGGQDKHHIKFADPSPRPLPGGAPGDGGAPVRASQTGHVALDAQARAGWKPGDILTHKTQGRVRYIEADEQDSNGVGSPSGAQWVEFLDKQKPPGMVSADMLSGYVAPYPGSKPVRAPHAKRLKAWTSGAGPQTGDLATWSSGSESVTGRVHRDGNKVFVHWESGRREQISSDDTSITFTSSGGAPVRKATPARTVDEAEAGLAAVMSRDEGRAVLAEMKVKDLRVLAKRLQVDDSGLNGADLRETLVEATVGVRADAKGIQSGDWHTGRFRPGLPPEATPAAKAISAPATPAKRAPRAAPDLDSVMADVLATDEEDGVERLLADRQLTTAQLRELAVKIGPPVSTRGDAATLRKNIAAGTAGLKHRPASLLAGDWHLQASPPASNPAKFDAPRRPSAPRRTPGSPPLDLDALAASIRATDSEDSVEQMLIDSSLTTSELRELARRLGPPVSSSGSAAQLRKNIAAGTAGLKHRPASVFAEPSVPSGTPAKKAGRAPRAAKAATADLTGANGLSADPAVREVQVENRIRAAYREAIAANDPGPFGPRKNGRPAANGSYVMLPDIRRRIGDDVSREEVDAALVRLGREGAIQPQEDQKWLTKAQRDASVRFGGQPMHMVTLQDPSPRPLPSGTPAKKAGRAPEGFDVSQLEGLTTRQKRARLRAMGFSPEQIDELAPTAARAKKASRSEDFDEDDLFRAEDLEDDADEEVDDETEDDEPVDEPVDEMDLALEHYEPLDAAARSRAMAMRAVGHDITPGHDELHHYWTRGEGLAKWVGSPKPWTTLVAHLTKYVGPEKAKTFASRWFIEVFHFAAGSDLNRVTHGHPPRGHRVGPG